MDLGNGKIFHLLTSEHLLQMTIFEKIVEIDIFYRDPKKCFSPLNVTIFAICRKNQNTFSILPKYINTISLAQFS